MAETLTIRTASSTEIVKIAVPGPQGATGQGVPVGGSTGQVLRKASGSDYDTEWAAAGSGSGSVTSVALASTDLTISGSPITSSGTITANIAANAVTLEKLQTISSEHLLGRHGNGNGGVQQVGLGTGLAMSGSNVRVATTGITAGTYTKLTVDETGRATVGATATPSDIGAQSAQDTETLSLSASVTLTGSRNKLWKISNNTASNYFVELPTTGIAVGDIVEIEYTSSTGRELAIRRDGVAFGLSLPNGTRATYRADTATATGWTAVGTNYNSVSSVYISQGDVLLGRQDVAGQVQFISCTAAGRALIDDSDASTQRSTLGLGTAATAATGDFAAASHSHELTALAATGATNGHVLTANGSNGATFAALPASGVTGAASSASDVLGVSGANITGVDANADRIVYWNNTANKLAYGTPADAGAAAASHTHAASDITSGLAAIATSGSASDLGSGTVPIARLGASGTPSGSTYLAGDNTWKAAGGVTTGSVDNAVLRADGTGGSTSQSSDLVIDDATTTTQNNVAIRNNHSETNSALVLCNKGTGAFIVSPARPDGTSTGGNARGANAVCIGSRAAANQVAAGTSSVRIGNNARSSGPQCISVGIGSVAQETDDLAIGNTSSATGNYCVAIGNGGTSASGFVSTAIGRTASASQGDTIAIGRSAAASAVNATAIGGVSTTANLRSQFATPNFSSVYWSGQTTTNAATILNLDGAATNRFTIAASTALAVDIILVARRATTQDKWLVARRFLGIRRDGSNNTSLIGAVQTLGTDQSAGSPTWTFALTADDTNEALQLEVTGATGETVEWRATAFYRFA